MSSPTIGRTQADFDIVNAALAIVTRHEGFRQFPYADAKNTIAIGYGTNLNTRGISTSEALLLARSDVTKSLDFFRTQQWWKCLNAARQCVILDMAYAIGNRGLLEFNRMFDDISRMDFVSAAAEILRSEFANQDHARAVEDAAIMRTGTLEVKADE